ncbi:MAG TPA: hypothetical protein VD859_16445 [Nocardioides sp.]|nr:hypothetical protein [Nocardioides sp.]
MSNSLEVPLRPRPSGRSRLWAILAVVGVVALVAGWAAWYATTPEELPVSARTVTAEGVTGTTFYVGMFAAPDDFDRSIHVSDVEVPTSGDGGAEITPLLCREGAVGVTTSPEEFCSELVEPEGEDLTSGDSIVLEVAAEEVGELTVDRVEISFREKLSWGTEPAGNAAAVLTITEPSD